MSRKGFMELDLSRLDVTKLHPLSPDVISHQATLNIGTIGHVAHGLSTVVKAISGVQVANMRHNEEERQINELHAEIRREKNGHKCLLRK